MKHKESDEKARVGRIIELLEQATAGMPKPMSELIASEYNRDPYLILISCLLSLRSRDTQTYPICKELFKYIKTPQDAIDFPQDQLEAILRPIGFYKKKAVVVRQVSQVLIDIFDSKVPGTEEELLALPGVGRKTSSLVLGVAFGIPAICVDVHVHRVSNRLGIVSTHTVEDTEKALKACIPIDKWIEINHLLVMWGQNICAPVSPWCSKCVLAPLCPKIGVVRRR
ncbi:MAG: endonuclease III [Candidatus Babeliaceae bacterium]|jgi:endonuclease-3